jgi:CheY-like chemotaxis protein
VAFLDLNMPDIGGLELAAALRAQSGTSRLRLVALTGMGRKADVERSMASGFDAHLTKPASPDAVIRLAAGATANVVPLHSDRKG